MNSIEPILDIMAFFMGWAVMLLLAAYFVTWTLWTAGKWLYRNGRGHGK